MNVGSIPKMRTPADEVSKPEPDPVSRDEATLALLESWRIEDATTDPELIAAAERELAQFKTAMNEPRALACARLLFP